MMARVRASVPVEQATTLSLLVHLPHSTSNLSCGSMSLAPDGGQLKIPFVTVIVEVTNGSTQGSVEIGVGFGVDTTFYLGIV